MATDPEASPFFGRVVLAFICALAIYFCAYFPAVSWEVRHPGYHTLLYAWELLPDSVQARMFRRWVRMDPDGFARLKADNEQRW
jgi:hypothetical protein